MDDFRWICCLNPREYAVLLGTILGLELSLFVGMPYDAWLLLWAGETLSLVPRQDAFVAQMELEIVTIVIGDPPVEVEVIRPVNLPVWIEIGMYIDTHSPLCSDGCEYTFYD